MDFNLLQRNQQYNVLNKQIAILSKKSRLFDKNDHIMKYIKGNRVQMYMNFA